MSRIIAIAFLAVRSAVRSRLFISLMVVMVLAVSILPVTIKGDGTLTGQITILLRYTLGFVAVILGLATLWSACGAIAQEVEDKQIHLVVTKPVHSFEIWLGKWLGLVLMNAVLLCVAGVVVYAVVRWSTGPSCISEDERIVLYRNVLTGRMVVFARSESESAFDREIHEQLERMISAGAIARDMSHDVAYTQVREQLLVRKAVIAPGASKVWVFDLPGSGHISTAGIEEPSFSFRFRFTVPGLDRLPVSGTWTVGTESRPALFTHRVEHYFAGPHEFSVPVSVIRLNQPVVVRFTNDREDKSRTLIFDPERNIELLVPESGFEMNLARALVIILCQVALLAAIGLTAGTIFSFPVAVFAGFAVPAMALMIHYFAFASQPGHMCKHAHHHHDVEQEHSVVREVSERGVLALGKVVEPAMRFGPLTLLSRGMLVSWRLTGEAVGLLFVIYSGFFGLLGGWFLRRRELGLPI